MSAPIEAVGACDSCVLRKSCCGSCWCCPWPAAEQAVAFAIRAFREGESRTYVEGVMKCLVGA